jgi:gas vesicle protein
MADKNRGTFIGGVILGAAIGAVAGLLAAPRKGRDTRKILQKTATAVPQMAEDISSSVKLQADRLSTAASDNWHDTLDRLSQAIEAGIVASQNVRQIDSKLSSTEKSKVKSDKE